MKFHKVKNNEEPKDSYLFLRIISAVAAVCALLLDCRVILRLRLRIPSRNHPPSVKFEKLTSSTLVVLR